MNDSPVRTGFHRTLLNGNMQIRSACKTCGTVLIGSVLHGIAESEASHMLECSKKRETHLFELMPQPPPDQA